MVVAVQISIKDNASPMLKRAMVELPKSVQKGIDNWGQVLENNMKIGLRQSSEPWDGKISNSIRWKSHPRKMGGELMIAREGIALDRMRPHFVSLNKAQARNIRVAEWAISKGVAREKGGRVIPGSIFVWPHPFIDRSIGVSKPKLQPMVEAEVKRSLRTK